MNRSTEDWVLGEVLPGTHCGSVGYPKAKPGSALLLSGPGIVIPAQLTYPGSDNAACAHPIQPALRVPPHDTPGSTDMGTVGSRVPA